MNTSSPGARTFTVASPEDRLWVGRAVADLAAEWGFDDSAVAAIQIATSELGANAARHGGGGTVTASLVTSPITALEVLVLDEGPGIEDIASSLVDGFSEGRMLGEEVLYDRQGLGTGLGAVARLMDSLEITNRPEGGLRVVARKVRAGE